MGNRIHRWGVTLVNQNMRNILISRVNYRKAYPIIKSLKKAKFNVICGVDNKTRLFETEGFSKYADNYVLINNPEHSEQGYIKSLIQIIKTYDINLIMPVGFIDFQLISKYKDELEKHCIIPIENYSAFMKITDKWRLQDICNKLKIKYPRSLLIRKDTDEIHIRRFVEHVGLPIVVKGSGDGSLPIYCSNIDDVLKKALNEKTNSTLLQEFINGAGVGYYVFSDKGNILTEFMHKRIFEASPLGGPSIKASSNYDSDLLKLGRKFVKAISWTGLMMVECKKESETGELYLLEVNPKFWGSLELSYTAGIDFPKHVAEYYLEGKKPNQTAYSNICFSWFTSTFLFYAKYGLPTLFEAIMRTVHQDLLWTDLHLLDPINLAQKVAMIVASMMLKFDKRTLQKIHYSRNFRGTSLEDLNCIISDFDGTLTRLTVNWRAIKMEAQNAGLLRNGETLNQGYYRLSLNDNKGFVELSTLVQKYEMVAVDKIDNNIELTKTIKEIKMNDLKLIIVSKQSEDSLNLGLKNMGILNYVDEIIGRETKVLRKNQILIGVNRIFNNENDFYKSIMVGDQLSDIKAALQLNISPWMIAKSNIKKIQALELGVNYADNINLLFDTIHTHKEGNKIYE